MTLDLKRIREYTGADDDFTFALFDRFLSHLDIDLADLQKETDAENWMAVKAKVHAMLSSARIFFLEEIIGLSEEIERNCQAEKSAEIPLQVSQLVALYRAVEGEIKTMKTAR